MATQVPEGGTHGWREKGQPEAIAGDEQDPFEVVDFGASTDDEREDQLGEQVIEVEAL